MVFTKKQQDALAKVSGQQRASLRANFERQNKDGSARAKTNRRPLPPGPVAGTGRANAVASLAQGAGAVTRRPFGGYPGISLRCWDAFAPDHLSLPRAVGPYSVMRTTARFNTSARSLLFAPIRHNTTNATSPNEWTNIACLADFSSSAAINGASNAYRHTFDMSTIGAQASIVPAAMSVQIVNPNPLTTTSGVVYAGVMSTQASFGGSSDTWDTVYARFIQRMAPRMLMAGKLALRGVHINSYPLNMTAMSDFDEMDIVTDGQFTWSNIYQPTGLAPILVHNVNSIDLEYLVTMEWRVRFDLSNPASGTHTHHPVTTDQVWDKMVQSAVSLGNGVRDISDVVAGSGQFADVASAMLHSFSF